RLLLFGGRRKAEAATSSFSPGRWTRRWSMKVGDGRRCSPPRLMVVWAMVQEWLMIDGQAVIGGEQEPASSSPRQRRRAAAQGSTVVCGWSPQRRRWQRPVVHDSVMAEGAGRWS
ncbi:hypothetical protein Dimus_005173, partial [Dionaea muscipula]